MLDEARLREALQVARDEYDQADPERKPVAKLRYMTALRQFSSFVMSVYP